MDVAEVIATTSTAVKVCKYYCDPFAELASENEEETSKTTTKYKNSRKTLECIVKSQKALPQIA